MNLPTVDRSIRDENASALLRRWEYALTNPLFDSSACQQWFPGQRPLLELLSVLSKDQVMDIADVGLPLFTVRTPVSSEFSTNRSLVPARDLLQQQAAEEVFIALMCRLDSLRTSVTQAQILYDLPPSHATFINRHGPVELRSIASDPSVVLLPSVAMEYFICASSKRIGSRERTVLACASRRKCAY